MNYKNHEIAFAHNNTGIPSLYDALLTKVREDKMLPIDSPTVRKLYEEITEIPGSAIASIWLISNGELLLCAELKADAVKEYGKKYHLLPLSPDCGLFTSPADAGTEEA